nr:PAS domain-containing protein [Bacteroidota bacterium]
MDDELADFKFNLTKDYAKFLLTQKFDEACLEYHSISEKINVPLINLLYNNKEDQAHWISYTLNSFLQQIIDDTSLIYSINFLKKWKSEAFRRMVKDKVDGYDFTLIYNIQKQLIRKLLPSYSSDCIVILSIIDEIEKFFNILERYTSKIVSELKSEIYEAKNNYLSSIINNSIDGTLVVDKELRIIEWNTVLEHHHGIKKKDIIYKKIFEVLPEYKNSEEAKYLDKILNGEKVFLTNRPYLTKNHGWYEVFMAPLYKGNEVSGIFSVFRDITKRKENEEMLIQKQQELEETYNELKAKAKTIELSNKDLENNYSLLKSAQEALKEKEAHLIEAQAVANLGSWEYDIENNKIYWTDELKRIYGYQPNDKTFNYEKYLDLLHPDDRELIKQKVDKIFQDHKPYSLEHKIIKKNGEVRWLLAHAHTVVCDNKVIKLKGTALDITERKRTEEKLVEEQHFIKKIADTTPNIITVIDLEKEENIYHNKEIYTLLGYSKDEINKIKKNKNYLKDLIHPEDLDKFAGFLEEFKQYTGTATKELEYRLRHKMGRHRWVFGKYNIFKKSLSGFPVQIIGISMDITEKKEAEIKLLEREMKLKESQSLAKIGHWELDIKSGRIYWSDGLYEIYGIPYGTALTLDKVKTNILKSDYDSLVNEIKNSSNQNISYQIEYRIKHPVSGIRTLFSRGQPVVDELGQVVKFKGITQDISERKKTESELQESQKFIQAITDSVPNMIFVFDVINEKALYSNRALSASLGYTQMETKAMGRNLLKNLVHPDDYKGILERNKKVKASEGNESFEVYYKIKHANGEWRWLRSLSNIFKYNNQGKPWQILGVIEDVTDKKLADEKLQQAYQEMQHMNLELAKTQKQLKKINNELEQRVEH